MKSMNAIVVASPESIGPKTGASAAVSDAVKSVVLAVVDGFKLLKSETATLKYPNGGFGAIAPKVPEEIVWIFCCCELLGIKRKTKAWQIPV